MRITPALIALVPLLALARFAVAIGTEIEEEPATVKISDVVNQEV